MCLRFESKNRSCWKELDDNLLYFQGDYEYGMLPKMRVRDISSDLTIKYSNICSTGMGVLNKQNSHLNILMNTWKQTTIGRLNKSSLDLKVTYRIFLQYLFCLGPIYDFSHNLLLIISNRRLIQLYRNKLIRKYKGNLEKNLNDAITVRMGLRQFNLLRKEKIIFLLCEIQQVFERIFNIHLFEIDQNYGTHIFKKIGNFIILKNQYKFRLQLDKRPVYYLSLDYISKGDGLKGKFCINRGENLKIIKQCNNQLIVVIRQDQNYIVYEIKGESERNQINLISKASKLKKPILWQDRLIFTNERDYLNPVEYKINFNQSLQTEN